jgi:hypothetical protein
MSEPIIYSSCGKHARVCTYIKGRAHASVTAALGDQNATRLTDSVYTMHVWLLLDELRATMDVFLSSVSSCEK